MNVALQRQLFVPWIRVAFAPQDTQVTVSEPVVPSHAEPLLYSDEVHVAQDVQEAEATSLVSVPEHVEAK